MYDENGIYQYMLRLSLHCLPYSSVGSVQDLKTGGHWFDPWFSQYSFRVEDSLCDKIHSSLTAFNHFDKVYVGKQPVAWKVYCA